MECSPCLKGLYQNEYGATTCLKCIPGQYQDQPESKNCTNCKINTIARGAKSIKCTKCEIGSCTIEEGAAACINCGAGRYGEGCQECPAGWKREENDAVGNCIECPLGSVSETGSASCSSCDLGKFGVTKGSCAECQPGRYQDGKGLSQCKPCPINTFYGEKGATALSQCEFCPNDRATGEINGSATNASCLCLAEKYYQDDELSVACTPCPNGGVCPEFGSVPIDLYAQAGYWQPLNGVPEFLRCADAHTDIKLAQLATERCCPTSVNCSEKNSVVAWTTDEQCMAGYSGPLCLACAKDYVLFENDCIECEGGSPFGIGIAGLSGVAFLVYLVTVVVLWKTKTLVEHVEEDVASRIAGLISIVVSWLQVRCYCIV
jgi:hypothetical protein